MFTGITEETGTIAGVKKLSSGLLLKISAKKILDGTQIGDSICVNGVCTTAIRIENDSFEVEISSETLKKTTFSSLTGGETVNLERALTPTSRMGGHIVQGHVDCTGRITEINKLSDFYEIKISVPEEIQKYIVYKGSVTINGISLTVAETQGNTFKTAISPHTYTQTNLKYLKYGDTVNIETDILGRYVEKLLSLNDNKKEDKISTSFLEENGFM